MFASLCGVTFIAVLSGVGMGNSLLGESLCMAKGVSSRTVVCGPANRGKGDGLGWEPRCGSQGFSELDWMLGVLNGKVRRVGGGLQNCRRRSCADLG